MPIQLLESDPLVRKLWKLASTSFIPDQFEAACLAIGRRTFEQHWPGMMNLTIGESPLYVFCSDDDLSLVTQAYLPFCYWDVIHSPDSARRMQAERPAFDRVYDRELKMAREHLGAPLFEGADVAVHGFRHAVWRGETALLVLQQSDWDIATGYDIDYCLTRWSGPDPRPTSPFSDWLAGLHAQPESAGEHPWHRARNWLRRIASPA